MRDIIDRRNRRFTHPVRSRYWAKEQNWTTHAKSIPRGLRSAPFNVPGTSSLEQRHKLILWCLMALLWILFLIAAIVLKNKTSFGA